MHPTHLRHAHDDLERVQLVWRHGSPSLPPFTPAHESRDWPEDGGAPPRALVRPRGAVMSSHYEVRLSPVTPAAPSPPSLAPHPTRTARPLLTTAREARAAYTPRGGLETSSTLPPLGASALYHRSIMLLRKGLGASWSRHRPPHHHGLRPGRHDTGCKGRPPSLWLCPAPPGCPSCLSYR